ncbi:MAG: FAD-dependent oxidoreductase [Eubacteriales bacterium]|nr:FAD-dependent oxidoreductase [Eubacteriales bacterium]
MYDVIIIGKGPAGISASLYTTRGNLKTLILAKGESEVVKSAKIDNYYGFAEPVSGRELVEAGEKQALRLGTEIIEAEVVALKYDKTFTVETSKEKYEAKAVILATGQSRKRINIANLTNFEGKGVAYCSTCDGFFYRDLAIGVLGFKDYAMHEATELETYSHNITIFTDGESLQVSDKYLKDVERFAVNTKKITKLDGDEFLQRIYFEDGTHEPIDGLFIAYGSASSASFARQLGVIAEGDALVVDENQMTNLEGLFAAGDCTTGLKQIAVAVGEGALAGKKAMDYIKSLKQTD